MSIKLELLNSEPTIIPREVLCFCALCFVLLSSPCSSSSACSFCFIDPVVYRGASKLLLLS